jgi:RNA polymerase sigma-70 factor (ECF subfamily)
MALDTTAVWKEFNSALRSFILKRVHDEEIAEDILQDTFIKIHRNLGNLKDEGKLRQWLYQVTRNTIMDHFRSHRATEALPDDVAEMPAETDSGQDVSAELGPCVKALMERLPGKDREAIEMTEFKGLSQKEISERLEMSFSGAKSRVQRARTKLKKLLEECCSFDRDRHGNILDYEPRSDEAPECCRNRDDCTGDSFRK